MEKQHTSRLLGWHQERRTLHEAWPLPPAMDLVVRRVPLKSSRWVTLSNWERWIRRAKQGTLAAGPPRKGRLAHSKSVSLLSPVAESQPAVCSLVCCTSVQPFAQVFCTCEKEAGPATVTG